VYTASAPLNVFVKNVISSTVPTAAFAPSASISETFYWLLVITVTSCFSLTNAVTIALLMLPVEPVMTYFIFFSFIVKLLFVYTND